MAGKLKLKPSTKIVIGAAVILTGAYMAFTVLSVQMIRNKEFAPVAPGEVNILGVDTKAGYYIVVANQVAQLVLGDSVGEFAAPDKEAGGGDVRKKRVPLRDLIKSLQGDEKALGRFVMAMNDISDAELPAYPIYWTASDIEKALAGDKVLGAKLAKDLNVDLDGNPQPSIRVGALQEGIVIRTPIPVRVRVGNEMRTLVGEVLEEYQPRFMIELNKELSEKSELTSGIIRGYYVNAARKLLDEPQRREPVRKTLANRISGERRLALAQLPEKVLNSVTVIVSNALMERADYTSKVNSEGDKLHDLVIWLTEEGRQRMWKYSDAHVGRQLLVVWDGIAIAAPKISAPIPFADVKINQIADEGLVKDTVDVINKKVNREASQ